MLAVVQILMRVLVARAIMRMRLAAGGRVAVAVAMRVRMPVLMLVRVLVWVFVRMIMRNPIMRVLMGMRMPMRVRMLVLMVVGMQVGAPATLSGRMGVRGLGVLGIGHFAIPFSGHGFPEIDCGCSTAVRTVEESVPRGLPLSR